ncbi:sulfatase [Algibacter sp. AS12]|uniref:sulfatase n=1 Tax=Algibacter sp. AS12 TaxID=3135773 RepID=UPI00398ABB10
MNFKYSVNLILGVSLLMISCKKNEKEKEIVVEKNIKPNIILIMADDLGYGELSCYGSTKINTPNIDKLASQGVKFLDFHSNGPVCSPTRAALMTGKYQQRTGVEGVITAANHREVGLSLDETTLAEELKNLGYATAMFGKWHLGYAEEFNPTYQGFETFTGFVGGNIDYHSHIDQEGYLDWWKGNNIDDEKGYTTDLITSYGVDYIKNNNPNKTGKPFFLYLSQESPHYPIQGRHDKPVREEGNKKYIRKVDKDSVQSIYTGMIETMDEGIGKIMKTVNTENLNENTIIIFCSDNGAAGSRGDNGVLRAAKASVYEGGHRVPAIISYPNQIKANTVSNATVLSMDFLPTLVDFAGGKPSGKNIDGVNFKSHLLNETNLADRNLYWVFGSKKAIRNGEWKLVTNQTEGKESIELFNLKNDVSEKQDVSANEPERVKNMLAQLENWQKEVRAGVVSVAK